MRRLSRSQNLGSNIKILELEPILEFLNEKTIGHKNFYVIIQEQSETVCFINSTFTR